MYTCPVRLHTEQGRLLRACLSTRTPYRVFVELRDTRPGPPSLHVRAHAISEPACCDNVETKTPATRQHSGKSLACIQHVTSRVSKCHGFLPRLTAHVGTVSNGPRPTNATRDRVSPPLRFPCASPGPIRRLRAETVKTPTASHTHMFVYTFRGWPWLCIVDAVATPFFLSLCCHNKTPDCFDPPLSQLEACCHATRPQCHPTP